MACDIGTAQDGEIYMAAAVAVRKMQKQLNNISAIADMVDKDCNVEPDRSTPVDQRISHILSRLLQVLAHQKRESE